MSAVAAGILANADDIVARCVEEMYRNPFWDERYGERGHAFSLTDTRHHLTYLAGALEAHSDDVMTRYAVWLQEVLTSRGMCSRHLDESFSRLRRIISELGVDSDGTAAACLESARAALVYDEGPARNLQLATRDLAAAAAATLYTHHADWQARHGERGRARCEDDLAYHLAYLADALALDRRDVFVEYAIFIAGFLSRRKVPVAELVESFDVLDSTLASWPDEAAVSARYTLDAARAALVDYAG